MKEVSDLLEQTENKLQIAEIALQTYERSKNPKLLVAIIQNAYIALNKAVSIVLLQIDSPNEEDKLKSKTLDSKLLSLQKKALVKPSELKFIKEMKEIIIKNKQSGIVFPRKGNLIICEKEYEMTILTKEKTESYLKKTKVFIKHLFSNLSNT